MLQRTSDNSKTRKKIARTFGVVFVAIFLLGAFLALAPVFAQGAAPTANLTQQGVDILAEPIGLPGFDIRVLVARIIRVALGLLGVVALVGIMYAGFLWMTAGGNEEQVGAAKKILRNGVIGLVIILLAYTIVTFVMRLFGIEGEGGGGGGIGLTTENFRGSGALGRIIKDHYPTRGQINVARNTKIIITFRAPVAVRSFTDDIAGGGGKGDGIFDNCDTNNFENWWKSCDHLKLSDNFINIKGPQGAVAGAAVVASYQTENGQQHAYTIVIKPITDVTAANGGYLGSPTEPISYTVHLGNGIKLEDDDGNDANNRGAFDSAAIGSNYYEWPFTCGTQIDLTPPTVKSVWPEKGARSARNTAVQVQFSEPIDPTGIQGIFHPTTTGNYFYLDGEQVFLQSQFSTMPAGAFKLTGGYTVLEFTPSSVCGQNACGAPIYCLPVCDAPSIPTDCKSADYQILLKAGRAINPPDSFEALPFSGIADIAGNTLDGNANNKSETAPAVGPVFDDWKQPDNFFWQFILDNKLDATSPYLNSIRPGINANNVAPNDPWEFAFSKRMLVDSLYTITIDEFPAQNPPLCLAPAAPNFSSAGTVAPINHCPFLDGLRQYYFPVASSSLVDVNFNCFYPGLGPGFADNQDDGGGRVSPAGTVCNPADGLNGADCCPVTSSLSGILHSDYCCNGVVNSEAFTDPVCRAYWENPAAARERGTKADCFKV